MMKFFYWAGLMIFVVSGCEQTAQYEEQLSYYQSSTDKLLKDIVDDAIFAITEHNFRLNNRLDIGKTIRERENRDFPDYVVLLYCNLSYAKKMLEIDPTIINFCPGRIIIRQIEGEFIVTAPLWPEGMTDHRLRMQMKKMNVLAREIVDYATEPWLLADG